ncbi:MAG: response regulator [Flavobacteriaceae bacterium]|nr:response regulator [Flavobacteriaceae bacterium]
MSRILIIEDEPAIRRVLVKILSDEDKSHELFEAENGIEGINLIKKHQFDLIISDVKMPKVDGIEVLEFINLNFPEIPFVMISGHGDLDMAVDSMKKGAFDYISKPPDLNRLLTTVRNALDKKKLIVENKVLKKKIKKNFEMIGESKAILEIKNLIEKVAETEAKILINGPNGSGKELVAKSIHISSKRADSPLIEVNCAAIPSELIESELFGHVKGSFTGAIKDKIGKFEAANNGTIFLDEIGDMSLSAQAKVLRVLQDNCIQKVGGGKDIKINVRVVAATNKDLKKEIEKGKFREDLYHRLAVIIINVPPLNSRRDDIPLLINHFSKSLSDFQGLEQKKFSKKALDILKKYDWSGNVRELRNIVERLTILGDSNQISEKNVKDYIKI